jgi:hypothetical protein
MAVTRILLYVDLAQAFLAKFSASPKREYYGLLSPMIPVTIGPWWMPNLTVSFLSFKSYFFRAKSYSAKAKSTTLTE